MNIRQLLLTTLLLGATGPLVGAVAGPAPSKSSCQEASQTEITAIVDGWQQALARGDADAVADFYADNAMLLPAMGDAPRNGKAAIRAYFAEFAGRHPFPIITMRALMTGCGMATETGAARYRLTGERKGTRMFVAGRYSTVFTERDGRWLIAQQSLSLMPQLNRTLLGAR